MHPAKMTIVTWKVSHSTKHSPYNVNPLKKFQYGFFSTWIDGSILKVGVT
jgi:hypothetical protein